MNTPLRCLMVEDSPDDVALLLRELRRGGYAVTSERVETAETMRAALERTDWDIVISDYSMPKFNGLAALELLKASGRDQPFILVSGTVGEELAVEALKAGANDYLMKDKLARLGHAVARALREVSERRERQQAAEALQFKNTLLLTQQEATIEGILVVDENGRVLSRNRRFVEMFGIPAKLVEEKNDEPLLQFVTAQLVNPGAFVERVRYLYEHRQETSQDEIALKDGRFFDRYSAPMFGPEERYYGRVWYFRDITERKKSEESLRLNNAALTSAANGIVITDRAGTIVWVNWAFTRLTGYTVAEAIGKNPRDLIKSGQQEAATYQKLWETISAGGVWHGELINKRKDGSHYPEEMTITPVLDAKGEITHFIAIKQDLTERKRAEAALKLFRAQIDQSSDAIEVVDFATGRFLDVNESACRTVGYTRAELLASTLFDVTVGVDRSLYEATNRRLKQEGHALLEAVRRRKDGTTFPVEVSLSLVSFDQVYLVAIVRDITERQQAEAALRTEQALLSSLMTTIPDHIYFKDRKSRFVRINDSMVRLFGLRVPAEVVGKTDFDFFTEDHARPAFESEQRMMETGEPIIGLEEKETWPDGRVSWVTTTKIPMRDEAGGITGLVGISHDITRRRDAAELLRHSEERYRMLFDDNPLPMWLSEVATLRFMAVNQAAVEHYGYTREEFLAMTVMDIQPAENRPALAKFMAERPPEATSSRESRHQRKDGSIIQVEALSRPLVFDGRPARLVLVADVTEKKLLEAKFLHVQRLESIGMLAAGIAHDLNNVLAPIVFAGPLLRSSLATPRDLKILETLEQSAARGTGLVKQILGFAHSTAGEFRSTQVKHLVRDIIGVVEETFPKSIELQQSVPSNLWPVESNATQIHQVLLNLCVNARDAMPRGGTLRLAAANRRLDAAEAATKPGARPGSWLVLEIGDTGSGIPPEVLERIWTPFFTTKVAGKGTGLGLSTVRSIVLSHRGFIELDTKVGHGSTFRVFLPAIEGETPRARDTLAPEIARGGGELILVVDDDAAILRITRQILELNGYRSVGCADGVEAIMLLNSRAGEISLVITDVDMPRIGGLAVARAALQIGQGVPLIAMSGLSRGDSDGSDTVEIQKLADAFLHKPFQAEDLLGTVHRLLQASK